MHVLIVEDDLDLGQALLLAVQSEGFSALWVRQLADVPNPRTAAVDCVLLDVSLPDGLGWHLLQAWRRDGFGVPVIVITARAGLPDRLKGFECGADDFLVKPFAMAELLARLGAVVRRAAQQASPVWQFGDLRLEPRARLAWLGDEPLALSLREYQLLLELARDASVVVSKGDLGRRLEPLGTPLDSATIEVHMSNLRRKLGAERVRTVRGVGYQLVT